MRKHSQSNDDQNSQNSNNNNIDHHSQSLSITMDNLDEINHIIDSDLYQQLLSLKSRINESKQQRKQVQIDTNIISQEIGSLFKIDHTKKTSNVDIASHNKHHKPRIYRHDKPHNKIWKCRYCPYTAAHKSTLAVHERVHTGEKPIKCPICNKGFGRRDYLTKHLRLHTGEKPHRCNICQRHFKQRSGLTNHIRNVHHHHT